MLSALWSLRLMTRLVLWEIGYMNRARNGTDRVYTHLFLAGCRSGQRRGKIGFGNKRPHLNMCFFHDFLTNIYCRKNMKHYFLDNPHIKEIWSQVVDWICWIIWFRTGPSDRLWWTKQWILGFLKAENLLMSWVAQSVQCLAMGWMTGRSRYDPWHRRRIFPVGSVSRPALEHTQPPIQCLPGVLSPGLKHSRDMTLITHPI
jgi:hypothetical protein